MTAGWIAGATRNGDGSVRRAPPSVRVVDTACVVFAVWTLCCHAVVAAGGSLYVLLIVSAAAGLGLIALRRARGPVSSQPLDAVADAAPRRDAALRVGGLLLAAACAVALREQLVATWWCTLLLLAAAYALFALPRPPRAEASSEGRAPEIALCALSGFCVVAALVAHRVDIDDVLYVNLAVAAADAPGAPLLTGDTLLRVAGLPIQLPVYRLHSYELWNAALAFLSGIPAIAAFHFVSAGLAAALVPLAAARLARWLTPRDWPWTVAVLVFLLVAVGEVHRWHGNFALVRIWQGKGIFLFVFLPLISAYAIEFALRPRAGSWLRLAAAQIAALGCTASAVWAGPFAALAAGACVLRPTRRDLRRAALLVLASSYVLGAGVLMRAAISDDPSAEAANVSRETERRLVAKFGPEGAYHAPGAQLDVALDLVLGTERLRVAVLFAVAAAWACCPPGLARRFAIALPLAVWLLLLNPYTTRFVAGNVTGATYWRALWVLPVLWLLALVLSAPLRLGLRPAWVGAAATVGACALFAASVPLYSALDPRNEVALDWPRLKVPPGDFAFAAELGRRAGPGGVVLAPWLVGLWLPMQHDGVAPLVVRPHYLDRHRASLGDDDVDLRLALTQLVSGRPSDAAAAARLAEGLERFDVDVVCLRDSRHAPRVREILRASGFGRDLDGPRCDVWVRAGIRAGTVLTY